MSVRPEVLAFGCREDDLAVLRQVSPAGGPALRVVDTPVEVAHQTLARRPVAVFIGVGLPSLKNLDVITVIRDVRSDLPVIVIADEDSLDLERHARRKNLFYYLVHPVVPAEVAAVLEAVLRHSGGN